MSDDWKKKISGCFGEKDLIFAGHPSDENSAFELLKSLRKDAIGWAETKEAINQWLASQNANAAHTSRQLAKAGEHFKPWILD